MNQDDTEVHEMKLGLGTVSFGMEYGVSNETGKTAIREAERILRVAEEAGIRTLDTAPHYGDSEDVLGRLLPSRHGFDIVTKIPALGRKCLDSRDGDRLRSTFLASLERLRQQSIAGLLLHNADDLILPGGEILYEVLLSFVDMGLVRKIGVSVYSSRQIESVQAKYRIDLVQVPINIFDQRLTDSGILESLKESDVEIHARSAFLQGLMFMKPNEVHSYFEPVKPVLKRFHSSLEFSGITPVRAALAFLDRIEELDRIIIGVNTAAQLQANIAEYRETNSVKMDFSSFRVDDERIVNPVLWRLS